MRYQVYQFSDKTDNFKFLDANLPKNGFCDQNFKSLSLDSESASLKCYVHQFSDKTDNFEFLDPNLLKNGFWGRIFKNLSLDSESAPPIYHLCQFWVKMDDSPVLLSYIWQIYFYTDNRSVLSQCFTWDNLTTRSC